MTHEEKLAAAKARYGKRFAHEINVRRVTEPSVRLREIERIQAELNNNPRIVTSIRKAK